MICLGDGSCRFIRNQIDPVTWMNMGPGIDGFVTNIP
jgi:hypothetical protein